jgi:hypothetical protein
MWESQAGELQKGMMAMLGEVLKKATVNTFAPHTWPNTLIRNVSAVLSGQTKYLEQDLKSLYASQEPGPLACEATAWLLTFVDKTTASRFASKGLDHLETADFERDIRTLFAGKTGMAESFTRLAGALRSLTPEEVETLASFQGEEGARLTRQAVKRLQDKPGQPAVEALMPVLREWWESQGQELLTRGLSRLKWKALVPEVH